MRFNDRELATFAKNGGQQEGRLQYRTPSGTFRDTGFRERFFRLVNNLLFYYRISEVGQVDFKEPVGVLVLENYSVRNEIDSDLSFGFEISFLDEPDKKHIFTARSEADVNLWMRILRQASYQHWKDKLDSMRINIEAIKLARSSPVPPSRRVQRMTDDLNLLGLVEKSGHVETPTSVVHRHNPFLNPIEKPPRPARPKGFAHIERSTTTNNNNEGDGDLIKF